MPSISRRHALQSTVALVSAFAGCSSETTPSPTPTSGDVPADAITNPPRVRLRNPSLEPIAWNESRSPTAGDTELDRWRHILVTNPRTAESLTFAAVDDVSTARQLLQETDFDSETVYVEERVIDECSTEHLCWVRWTETSIATSYATTYRDADVACKADSEDVITHFVRLPVALSERAISQFESSGGSGPCRPVTSGEGSK